MKRIAASPSRQHLPGLVRLGVLWPVAVLAWILALYAIGEWALRREVEALRTEAQRDLQMQSLNLRSLAEKYKHLPYVAAQQPLVQEVLRGGESSALIGKVDRYLQDIDLRSGADAVFLMDAKGKCIAASNWYRGPNLSFKGDDYGFRQYFRQALQRGWGVDYAVGSTTGEPGLFYASPVRNGDTAIGVVAIKVRLPELEENWAKAASPLYVLDQRGIVILSSVKDHLYRATRKLTAAELADLHAKRGQYGRNPDGTNKDFVPLPWTPQVELGKDYTTADIEYQGRQQHVLIKEEVLYDYDWTLVVTKDLALAQEARWIAIVIATLASVALYLSVLSWRQRGQRVVQLRQHQEELEGRVAERTRDLAQANVLLKAMKDSLPVGIRVMNEDGQLTDLNAMVCEITGYSEAELKFQRPPYAYWHPEEIDKHRHDLQAALEGHAAPGGQEQRFRHKLGHDIHVMIYTAPLVYGGARHGYVSSMVDITRHKQMEDRQRAQEAALRANAALVSMGELVFSLTHELGSPFMAISSSAAVASRHLESGNTNALRDSLAQIEAQARRAREIMQHIRKRVPKHRAGYHPCAINTVVSDVMQLLKGELRRQKVRASLVLGDGLPDVLADHILLEQVVLNLVTNGIQAMQDTPARERTLTIETGLAGREVFVVIRDNGPGISEAAAEQLFTLFYTTKVNGLGVGLNFCKTTIEEHSGRLEFGNRAPRGAAFTVYLPATETP